MMKKHICLTILLISLLNISFGQSLEGRFGFYNYYIHRQNIKFYTYDGYRIKGNLNEYREKDLQTPEGLMLSYESCNSQEWYDKLRLEASKFTPNKKIMGGDLDTNYIQLLNKILISQDGAEYCILKFYIKRSGNGFPVNFHMPACLSMQKANGMWKLIPASGIIETYYDIMYAFQSKFLNQIFSEGKCEEPVIDQMLKASKKDGVLDIGQFYYQYMSLFEGDYKNNLTIQTVNDQGYSDISISNEKTIKEFNCNFSNIGKLRFYHQEYNKPESLYKGLNTDVEGANKALLQLINESNPSNSIGSIFKNVAINDTSIIMEMLYKMEFEYAGKTFAIIKYKVKNKNTVSYNVISMEIKNGDYIYSNLSEELMDWYDVINILKPRYIDKIKASRVAEPKNFVDYFPIKVKSLDESGNLNISLLHNTLKDLERTNPELYKKVTN